MQLKSEIEGQLQSIRETARTLVEQGKMDDALELVLSTLRDVVHHNQDLKLQILKYQRERAGKRTEKVNPEQLLLMFEEMCRLDGPTPAPDPEEEDREHADLEEEDPGGHR